MTIESILDAAASAYAPFGLADRNGLPAAVEAVLNHRDTVAISAARTEPNPATPARVLVEDIHRAVVAQWSAATAPSDAVVRCIRTTEAAKQRVQIKLDELEALRNACWQARTIMGFDTDGTDGPDALVSPPLAEVVVRDAKRMRADYDEALTRDRADIESFTLNPDGTTDQKFHPELVIKMGLGCARVLFGKYRDPTGEEADFSVVVHQELDEPPQPPGTMLPLKPCPNHCCVLTFPDREQAIRVLRAFAPEDMDLSRFGVETPAETPPIDRARETSRRMAAVETLFTIGYKWHHDTRSWSPPDPQAPVSNTTGKLIDLLRDRDARGRAKYGVSVDRNDLTQAEWCQHMIEELLDAAQYAQRIKDTAAQPPVELSWVRDEVLEVLTNVDTQFRATGQASGRIERLINLLKGMRTEPLAALFVGSVQIDGIDPGKPGDERGHAGDPAPTPADCACWKFGFPGMGIWHDGAPTRPDIESAERNEIQIVRAYTGLGPPLTQDATLDALLAALCSAASDYMLEEHCSTAEALAHERVKSAWAAIVAHYAASAQTAAGAGADRNAYEGAREALLEWKGRAQRAEATLRSLGYTGIDASHPPASAADGAGELPPLPEPGHQADDGAVMGRDGFGWEVHACTGSAYTEEQMHAYARAAIARCKGAQP